MFLTLQEFLQGDASKAARELGWKPKTTFKVSLTTKLPQVSRGHLSLALKHFTVQVIAGLQYENSVNVSLFKQ